MRSSILQPSYHNSATLYTIPRNLLCAALLCIVGALSVRADNTLVTFSVDMSASITNGAFNPGTDSVEAHGTFNNWGALPLVQQGNSTVYTNSVMDSLDPNGGKLEYKFAINGYTWETPAVNCNRVALLPATSGASVVLPTAFFGDGGPATTSDVTFRVDLTQQIQLGKFLPATDTVEVRATGLNNWSGGFVLTNDPTLLRTNEYGLITSNVYVGTFTVTGSPGGADDYKFVLPSAGIWESPSPLHQNCRGNRFFADTPQTLPVFDFNDAPSTLVTFSVDLSAVAAVDSKFDPQSVTVNGDFSNWGGIQLTNDPSAPNPNLYQASLLLYEGSTIHYQFRYNALDTGGIAYDLANGTFGACSNRQFVVPRGPAVTLPTVLFNDAPANEYLTQPITVTFTVDMDGAVTTDGHPFDGSVDNVYLNGALPTWYSWGPYGLSSALPFQMSRLGSTSLYTLTLTLPPGVLAGLHYKYGIDPGPMNAGPLDNEAPFMVNHYRVIRCTKLGSYVLPTDTFGHQYAEPYLDVGIGSASGGKVPVTWLGRPQAHLQVNSSLAPGAWQDLWETAGTNWTSGSSSTNGFTSQTNWSATTKAFFRVVKP